MILKSKGGKTSQTTPAVLLCLRFIASHVYIHMQDVYDKEFVARIHQLPSASLSEVFSGTARHSEVKLQYQNRKDFESIAKRLKIMSDLRVSMDYNSVSMCRHYLLFL